MTYTLEERKQRQKYNNEKRWLKLHAEATLVPCACGCGALIKSINKQGRPVKFIRNHNQRKYAYEKSELINCACGCGEVLKNKNKDGVNRRFIHGHNTRKYSNPRQCKKEWNKRNRTKTQAQHVVKLRLRKQKLIVLKGGKCNMCGVEYNGKNACIFDFHHLLPDKKTMRLNLSKLGREWNLILKEIENCALLCSNCHRTVRSDEY